MNIRKFPYIFQLGWICLLTAMAVSSCIADSPENVGVAVGDEVPAFEVTLNDGALLSRSSLLGKVGVLVFFSTTCGDCRRELPQVEEVYRHFSGDEEVVVVAVSREEKPGAVEELWNELGLTFPYSAQQDRAVYNLFATVGVPRVYVTDRRGTVADVYDDSAPLDAQTLIRSIDRCK